MNGIERRRISLGEHIAGKHYVHVSVRPLFASPDRLESRQTRGCPLSFGVIASFLAVTIPHDAIGDIRQTGDLPT